MGGSSRPLGGADAAQRVRSFGYACSAVVRKKEPQCVDHFDSLLRFRNSLFVRIVSLLVCVGNCRRSACSTEVSCSETDPHRPKTAKFPVKFPVTRETAWRQVRSELRRQGGSLVEPRHSDLLSASALAGVVQPLAVRSSSPKAPAGRPCGVLCGEIQYDARVGTGPSSPLGAAAIVAIGAPPCENRSARSNPARVADLQQTKLGTAPPGVSWVYLRTL